MGEIVHTTVGPVEVENYRKFPKHEGSTRKAYIGTEWVYKVGHGRWGQEQNVYEANTWSVQQGKGKVNEEISAADAPIAECYLLNDGTLMMERVATVRDIGIVGDWHSYSMGEDIPADVPMAQEDIPDEFWRYDSAQCGYNRHGALVLYDL